MAELWDVYDCNRKLTGRIVERGQPLSLSEYHVVVQVWIHDSRGQWLISKRTLNKSYPLKWEPTGGSVLAGEDSISAAVRETKEEVGISLNPADGELFASYRREQPCWENPGFLDVWVFHHDCALEDIVLQKDETCDAMWATSEMILEMIANGSFVPMKHFPYCYELFCKYGQEKNI